LAIAVAGGRVFVAGSASNAAANDDFLVRAYNATTGTLRQEDQVHKAGGFDEASAVAVGEERVFVAGSATSTAGNRDFLVRAYDGQ
jgi:hypothetical protein